MPSNNQRNNELEFTPTLGTQQKSKLIKVLETPEERKSSTTCWLSSNYISFNTPVILKSYSVASGNSNQIS
jgi:hypothetical protein